MCSYFQLTVCSHVGALTVGQWWGRLTAWPPLGKKASMLGDNLEKINSIKY